MTLKNTRLARAEDLSHEDRTLFNLPDFGPIIIQTTNPNLKDEAFSLNNGFREYLLRFGEFNEANIED